MQKVAHLPETITAPRTDPIYNCHSYLTKVPIEAIEPFIEAFTKSGDVIADFFAGSGMTGLAALRMGRSAKLSDISALGQHIAHGYLQNIDASTLRAEGDRVIDVARKAIGNLYLTRRASDLEPQEMIRTVWSFTYCCPACKACLTYYEHLDKKGRAPAKCPSCKGPFVRRLWTRGEDVPVAVVVTGANGRQSVQSVSRLDRHAIRKASRDKRVARMPSRKIGPDREMYSRSGLRKAGLTETKKFFSARNAIALVELWRAINGTKDPAVRQKLRFAFTAILPRASRRYQWSPQGPLNAQNQTYYIAPVYYEWNVFDLYKRKVSAAVKANEALFSNPSSRAGTVSYDLFSADKLRHIADRSIDYVFVDPPFGGNIFYSDMNLFHEAWLGRTTDHKFEAVVHTTGKRKDGAEQHYQRLLQKSFEEARRILKPGKYMSVVFGNSSGRVWGLVQRALRDAGFNDAPVNVVILEKGQRSVKGLNSGSEEVATVDLVLTVRKAAGRGKRLVNGDKDALIRQAVRRLSLAEARNPSHVYARVLRAAIQRHFVLDDLHLGDVLASLRKAGYFVDQKTGMLKKAAS